MSDACQGELTFLGTESLPALVRAPEGNGCAKGFIRPLKENLPRLRTFDTVGQLRQAPLELRRICNSTWLIKRHAFRPPDAVRQDQLSTAALAASAATRCLTSRRRYSDDVIILPQIDLLDDGPGKPAGFARALTPAGCSLRRLRIGENHEDGVAPLVPITGHDNAGAALLAEDEPRPRAGGQVPDVLPSRRAMKRPAAVPDACTGARAWPVFAGLDEDCAEGVLADGSRAQPSSGVAHVTMLAMRGRRRMEGFPKHWLREASQFRIGQPIGSIAEMGRRRRSGERGG
jgi:hypothetical protein